ncbi:FAD-binding oxidoreductase [Kibdelosporangium aridum]|uniref:FAD-binding oxidoreductase n=1 Tax=Kibdelosporangium aridum TaxID=2030 RepID=A0A428YTW5_KIBAR|nr:FAD-binding oxidoreductase [Kibdelosporangium aridum]RSM73023.1 FAD-binding oxidoreductase [Kibdelosporangium aridum]
MITIKPGDSRYDLLRSAYTHVHSPAEIVLPEHADEVAAALRTDLPISVRSGGHGLPGRSSNDGGTVIDLSLLNTVELIDDKVARIGAGARWAQVAKALLPHGLVISSGDHGNVGVGGLATAGGIGWLARSYGLTIDHVRAVELVLADGTSMRVDADHELFWAVRGAGDLIGVATSFEIEAVPVPNIGYGQVVVEADARGDTIRRWSEYMTEAHRDLTTTGIVMPHGKGFVVQFTAVVASDNPQRIQRLVEPLAALGVRPLDQAAQIVPYQALLPVEHIHPNYGQQQTATTNGLLPTLTETSAQALMDIAQRALVQLRALGGAINDVKPDETAYVHRHQQVMATLTQFQPTGDAELTAVWKILEPHADGVYRGFDSRWDKDLFRRAFPGDVWDSVLDLRRRHDPDGVFSPFLQ